MRKKCKAGTWTVTPLSVFVRWQAYTVHPKTSEEKTKQDLFFNCICISLFLWKNKFAVRTTFASDTVTWNFASPFCINFACFCSNGGPFSSMALSSSAPYAPMLVSGVSSGNAQPTRHTKSQNIRLKNASNMLIRMKHNFSSFESSWPGIGLYLNGIPLAEKR